MIRELASAGAMPTLELGLRFAGQRQKLIAHNIANITTPNFVQKDVSPTGFQKLLAEAVEDRRSRNGGSFGELRWRESREVRRAEGRAGREGMLELTPRTDGPGILYHDRNNRDLERLMQDQVENATYYRVAVDLMRQHRETMRTAIAQRV